MAWGRRSVDKRNALAGLVLGLKYKYCMALAPSKYSWLLKYKDRIVKQRLVFSCPPLFFPPGGGGPKKKKKTPGLSGEHPKSQLLLRTD